MFYRYVIVCICYVLFHCVLFSVKWAFLPEINVMMRMAVSSRSVWDLGRSSIQHGSLRCVLKHENDSCDKTYLDRFRITEWMWRVWDPDGIRFEMTPRVRAPAMPADTVHGPTPVGQPVHVVYTIRYDTRCYVYLRALKNWWEGQFN